VPTALPELDLRDVDTRVTFLGKELAFPLIVGSMTGGTAEAGELNRRLALAATRCGIGMALGSQRVMLRDTSVRATFAMRDVAPGLPLLIANVGAVQLNPQRGQAMGLGSAELLGLARAVAADALVMHLNAAQEAVQTEGDTNFAGLAARMRDVAGELAAAGLPTGFKEVGAGFATRDLQRLASADAPAPWPFAFVESAGQGGTSWTAIEGMRARDDAGRTLGALFANWGVPSPTSLLTCVRHAGGRPVIASGGLRTALDAARALAAGAHVTAMALPLLKAAAEGVDQAADALWAFRDTLRTAMFLVGARTVDALRRAPIRVHPEADPDEWEGRRR
jgi:isopentenyl-diphosphate delta-isomerase